MSEKFRQHVRRPCSDRHFSRRRLHMPKRRFRVFFRPGRSLIRKRDQHQIAKNRKQQPHLDAHFSVSAESSETSKPTAVLIEFKMTSDKISVRMTLVKEKSPYGLRLFGREEDKKLINICLRCQKKSKGRRPKIMMVLKKSARMLERLYSFAQKKFLIIAILQKIIIYWIRWQKPILLRENKLFCGFAFSFMEHI